LSFGIRHCGEQSQGHTNNNERRPASHEGKSFGKNIRSRREENVSKTSSASQWKNKFFWGIFVCVSLFSLPHLFSFYFPTAAASERVTRWGRGERTCTSRFSLISSSTLFSLLLLLPRGAKYPVTK
jgi:hypothetical protein